MNGLLPKYFTKSLSTIASKSEYCCDYQAIIYSEFKQGKI